MQSDNRSVWQIRTHYKTQENLLFKDGVSESLSASLIAQNLYSQIDEKGNRHILLKDIFDHRQSNSAIDKGDAFIMMKNGVKRRCETKTKMAHVVSVERQ